MVEELSPVKIKKLDDYVGSNEDNSGEFFNDVMSYMSGDSCEIVDGGYQSSRRSSRYSDYSTTSIIIGGQGDNMSMISGGSKGSIRKIVGNKGDSILEKSGVI